MHRSLQPYSRLPITTTVATRLPRHFILTTVTDLPREALPPLTPPPLPLPSYTRSSFPAKYRNSRRSRTKALKRSTGAKEEA